MVTSHWHRPVLFHTGRFIRILKTAGRHISLKIQTSLAAGVILLIFLFPSGISVYSQELLPPVRDWKGRSEKLMVPPDHPWVSPAEKSGFTYTPTYSETMDWLAQLCDLTPMISMRSVGMSPEGRDIILVTVSQEKDHSSLSLRKSGKPLIFIQAGIHAGEIDGKDAGLMLLRDIALGDKTWLSHKVNIIFIPILNVDGHERSSPFNRINQRGPENMGWRTNSMNLNLNRDYAKLDTREIRSVVQIMNEYEPDLYIDIHVTDGIDYQYDITMGSVGPHGYSPVISEWMNKRFYPEIYKKMQSMGHIPGPIFFALNDVDYRDGVVEYCFGPSFSDNYADARHIPAILVENHSLKPYRQRVLGTYVFLQSCIEILSDQQDEFFQARNTDKFSRVSVIPSGFQIPQFKGLGIWGNFTGEVMDSTIPPDTLEVLAISSIKEYSRITGDSVVRWTGEPVTLRTPIYRMNEPVGFIELPEAYWIPPAWNEVIERLKIHGIQMEIIQKDTLLEVEVFRFFEPVFTKNPYENHQRVSAKFSRERLMKTFPAGSVKIPTEQKLAELAALLLEPESSESFFQWGFFLPVFSRTEYAEAYVLEPLAKKMLDSSPSLLEEFEQLKSGNPEFANNPDAILRWFYMRSDYYDKDYLLYPVGRELKK